jgi:hypothetical protein
MLHLLYILAFTVLAFLAVGNLIRNLMTLGRDSQRGYGSPNRSSGFGNSMGGDRPQSASSHPELLDQSGNLVKEPYLVMKSITVEDARERLDALYNASPGSSNDEQTGERE